MLLFPALAPIKVLLVPVVDNDPALVPINVLPMPEQFCPAALPTAVEEEQSPVELEKVLDPNAVTSVTPDIPVPAPELYPTNVFLLPVVKLCPACIPTITF